jgi:hypothetical protein
LTVSEENEMNEKNEKNEENDVFCHFTTGNESKLDLHQLVLSNLSPNIANFISVV